jgi:protein SCO1/2
MHATRTRHLALVTVVLATLTIAACSGSSSTAELVGLVREPRPVVATVTLPDASSGGGPFSFRATNGHVLLVYFGYTSCPDVCPTTLADVRKALAQLGDDASKVDVAMATIDPGRDTTEKLTAYVQTFVPAAHALRTEDPAQLRAAADALGADYSVETNATGQIEVAHTAFIYAIDANGVLLLQWPFGVKANDMRSDLRQLLATTAGS